MSSWAKLPTGIALAFCPTGEGGGVDPTCGKGEGGSKASSASIEEYDIEDEDETDAVLAELLTGSAENEADFDEFVNAVGVTGEMGDAIVSMSVGEDSDVVYLTATTTSEDGEDAVEISRNIYKVKGLDGKDLLTVENAGFFIADEMQGKGIGGESFAREVEGLSKLGVHQIKTMGARDDEKGHVGYEVWPKMGYDGSFPNDTVRAAAKAAGVYHEPHYMGARFVNEIQALHQTAEGRAWWSENGIDVPLTFDLSPNSTSMKVFNAYRAAKAKQAAA